MLVRAVVGGRWSRAVDEDVEARHRATVRNEGWEGVWEVRERAMGGV
jgi:hypothetical protein